jgi:hypothetical protein
MGCIFYESTDENQLTSVNIPISVTTIGWGAFSRNQLTSVRIYDAVDVYPTAFNISLNNDNPDTNFTEVYDKRGGTFTRSSHTDPVWVRQP